MNIVVVPPFAWLRTVTSRCMPGQDLSCTTDGISICLQGSQFGLGDVEVVTATVDLDEVVSYRGAVSSLQEQASSASPVATISVDFDLCHPTDKAAVPSAPIEPHYHLPEEEIALGRTLNQLPRASPNMGPAQPACNPVHHQQ